MTLQVNVNGQDLCIYKHRIPLEKVSVLSISGDVSVNMIGFVMVRILNTLVELFLILTIETSNSKCLT